MKKIIFMSICCFSFAFLVGPSLGHADVDILKVYREVNPDLKPNCMYCHLDKLPKKDPGTHELNAYGKKMQEMCLVEKKEMTKDELKVFYTEVFKKLGRHDSFVEGAEGESAKTGEGNEKPKE